MFKRLTRLVHRHAADNRSRRGRQDAARARRRLQLELRQAIETDQLVLHYQPLAGAGDGEVLGFEALVRWNHPVRGLLPPLEFIPLAEATGLIEPLGEWVLRKACAEAATWVKPLRVAVNLSPRQLHRPQLPALVAKVLADTGLAAHRLELEITETALFDDATGAIEGLKQLKQLGLHVSMDDFGAGFSSLSTLHSFAFDKLKIDRRFVSVIQADPRAAAIVRAVLGLGRSLSIPVVAEGVETDAQLDFLRLEGCAQVQGFGIGRPAPMETLAHLIGGWRPADAHLAAA